MKLAACFAVLCASGEARAQEATAIDRLTLAPAGDPFLTAPSAEVQGTLRPAFGLLLSYAHAPLVVREAGGDRSRKVIEHLVSPHLLASLSFLDRALVFVDVPFVAYQSGEPNAAGLPDEAFAAPEPTIASDIPVGGRVELLGPQGYAPSVALGITALLPAGDATSYGGAGSTRFLPEAIVSADYEVFLWSVGASRLFEVERPRGGNLLGDEVGFHAAAAARDAFVQLGAELELGVGVGDPASHARLPVRGELLGSARAEVGPVAFHLAAGPGISRAPGTPTVRALGGVSVSFDALAPDQATPQDQSAGGDPAAGKAGAAPGAAAGAVSPPAAEADRDGDGVPNGKDACPSRPGPPEGERPGCPPDRDGDRIADADDACPELAGVPQADLKRHGCPLDSDGDGLPDQGDPCPLQAGPITEDRPAGERGCPVTIRVQDGRLALLEPIQFETGKATLLPESNAILDEVSDALQKDPTIVRVAVDGHTDNRGIPQQNLELSRARAVAVVRYLTERGVDARRLEARGFGQKQPVADNRTAQGRTQNRRVEFVVLRRDPRGEQAWTEGTLAPKAPEGGGPR